MPVLLRRYGDALAAAVHDLLLDIHDDCAGAVAECGFDPRARFSWLLDSWSSQPGWACVIGYDGDQPVGFAHGAPLTATSSWWNHVKTPLTLEFTHEPGGRTFAMADIMVRPPWRKTGTAARIHQHLLAGRPEERATLLVDRARPKVQALYETWGYAPAGITGPFDRAESMTALVRVLRPA